MELDFNNTCPTIDKSIKDFEYYIKENLNSILKEYPEFKKESSEEQENIITTHYDNIYKDVEPIFEDLRTTNSDMRNQANNQIKELSNEIESWKEEVETLKEELDDC